MVFDFNVNQSFVKMHSDMKSYVSFIIYHMYTINCLSNDPIRRVISNWHSYTPLFLFDHARISLVSILVYSSFKVLTFYYIGKYNTFLYFISFFLLHFFSLFLYTLNTCYSYLLSVNTVHKYFKNTK